MLNKKVSPVYTIVAPTLDDCRRQLYDLHGTDYTITGHHTVPRGGFLGLFQRQCIEATYILNARQNPVQTVSTPDDFQRSRDELLRSAVDANPTQSLQIANLNKTVEELKKSLTSRLDTLATVTAAQANEKHPTIQKIEEILSDNEFTFSYINEISNRIREEFSYADLDNFDIVERRVVDWIGESIKIAPRLYRKLPHVIILVGPTGVGKTTTVAKIAANIILDARNEGKPPARVRMVTIDRTRVGAEEQLRRFGEIMNIDVDKAETADDVKKIFETYKDSLDALIIDSSGYSPNDYENIGKMRTMLNVKGLDADVYLTITASTKAKDLISIIQNYETFNFGSVIVTKCDETSAYGNVLSVLAEKHKSISYITDGQKVPRNIERASVVNFLTRLDGFRIDRIHIEDTFAEDK
ncbi:MAG: flagellar biosynthesis protein FlhF [Treponema sp.]|nr:flagellar biosynthesis protein FlhF [Treponema sp.]